MGKAPLKKHYTGSSLVSFIEIKTIHIKIQKRKELYIEDQNEWYNNHNKYTWELFLHMSSFFTQLNPDQKFGPNKF